MANDALAQSGIDIGLSGEADYEAAYAAVMATERGRWFLTELANRTRHADTDALMAAIARVEAAVRGGERPAPSAHPADAGAAAAERVADIALQLRERGADAALCDALDVAVGEIGAACGNDATSHETENGAAPDRAFLAPPGQIAGDTVDADSASPGEAFDMPLQDSAKFAAAAAALAASLTALSEEAQAANEPQSTSSVIAAIPPQDYEAVPQPAAASAKQGPRWHIEAPDFVFHRPQRDATDRVAETSGQTSRRQTLLPGLQLLPGADEDPAELFEPSPKRVAVLPAAAPATTAAKPPPTPLASAVSAAAQAVHAMSNPPSSRSPTTPTVRPMPRPAPISPLAALRALTEEELIALFG